MKSSTKPCGLTSRDLYEDRNWSTSEEFASHLIKAVYFLKHSNTFVKHHYHSQRWHKFKASSSHIQSLQGKLSTHLQQSAAMQLQMPNQGWFTSQPPLNHSEDICALLWSKKQYSKQLLSSDVVKSRLLCAWFCKNSWIFFLGKSSVPDSSKHNPCSPQESFMFLFS